MLPTPSARSWFALVVLALLACAASASELPIVENGKRVGTVHYEAPESPSQAAYILAVADSVLAARRSLAAMEWPLERQPTGIVIDVSDLGPDRLGLTTIDGRVRVTTRERLADPGEDFRPRLKATVAHEYIHMCQYACWSDLTEASEPRFLWWMEACAIWFEHRVAPRDRETGRKVLTYEDAVPEARGAHGRDGLESASGGSSLGYCYAPLAFVLARAHGPKFLTRTWLRLADRRARATSAVQAIEATLVEFGVGPIRSRFDSVFREYALFMMSPHSQFLRDQMGLDVLQEERLAGPSAAVDLPGWSFRVLAPRAHDLITARASAAPGLRAYLIGVDGDVQRVQRIDGQESLAISRGGTGWPARASEASGPCRGRSAGHANVPPDQAGAESPHAAWLVLVNASPRAVRTQVTLGSLSASAGE